MSLNRQTVDSKNERHTANDVWQRTGGSEKGNHNKRVGRAVRFTGTHSDQSQSVNPSHAIPIAAIPENHSAATKPYNHRSIAVDGDLIQQKVYRAPPSRDVTPGVAFDQHTSNGFASLMVIRDDVPDRYPFMGQAPRNFIPDNLDTRALESVYRFSQTERNNVNQPAAARLGPDHNMTYAIPFTGNRGALYPVPRNAAGPVMDDEKLSASFRDLSGKTTVHYGPTGSVPINVVSTPDMKPFARGCELVTNMSGNAINRPVYQSADESYRVQVAAKQLRQAPQDKTPYKNWTNTVWRGFSFNPANDKPLYTDPHSFNRYPWVHGNGHHGIYYDPSRYSHGVTGGTYGVYNKRYTGDIVALPRKKRTGEFGNVHDSDKQKVQISIGEDTALAGRSGLEEKPYFIRTTGGDSFNDDTNEALYAQDTRARKEFLGMSLKERSNPLAKPNAIMSNAL